MLPDLTQYMWILWLALVGIFVIIELLTLEFTFLMLAAGSLIGGLGVNVLGGPWWLQIAGAAVVSALLLFTIRPLLLKALRKNSENVPMNVDAITGMSGRVIESFVNSNGAVKLENGETWSARLPEAIPDAAVAIGTRVVVTRVLGATVEVATPTPPIERTVANG
ncbi:NfeD family protein (plasmid) [Coraliomargarita sp. W4R53]